MALLAVIEDFDSIFKHLSLSRTPPLVVNDQSNIDFGDDEEERNRLVKKIDNDSIGIVPSCECGDCIGLDRLGDLCPSCGTLVKETTGVGHHEDMWLRAPKGVPALLNPAFVSMLIDTFKNNKKDVKYRDQNFVAWMLNSNLRPGKLTNEMLSYINDYKLKRGMTFFIENMHSCMCALYQIHNKKYEGSMMHAFVKKYKKEITPQYIPILGKNFVVVEETPTGPYTAAGIPLINDAINLLKGIDVDRSITGITHREADSRAAKAVLSLCYFRLAYMRDELFKKESLIRQHCFGFRSHFTLRAVATSITGKHKYDEVYLPWGASIAMLRLHLSNLLLKRGYTPTEINNLINSSIHSYSELIDQCLDDLISMTKFGYLDILVLRNPTLTSGSIQRLKGFIKRDPFDLTISNPIMNVRMFNLDFDGDTLSVSLIPDDDGREQTEYLKPHYAYLDTTAYAKVNHAFDFPKPMAAIIRSYALDQEDGETHENILKLILA